MCSTQYSASSATSAAPSSSSRRGTTTDERSSAFVTPLSTPRRRASASVSPSSSASDILQVLSPISATQIVGSTLSYRRSDSASRRFLGTAPRVATSVQRRNHRPASCVALLQHGARRARRARLRHTRTRRTRRLLAWSPQSRTTTRSSGTPTRRSVSGSSRSYSSSYRSRDSAGRPPASSVGYDISSTSDWTECFSSTGETETPIPLRI